jgi:hypothetical protein
VQSLGVRVEPVAPFGQRLVQPGQVGQRDARGVVQRGLQVGRDAPSRRGPVVYVHDQAVQAAAGEPVGDRRDRRALLRDEEHPLAARHQRGDQVGDGLALAGTGWALHDRVLAGEDRVDRPMLRGVGVQDHVLVGRGRVVGRQRVDLAGTGGQRRERRTVAGHRGDHVVPDADVLRRLQVGDHRQLGVGEGTQHEARGHREAADPAGRLLDQPLEDRRRIEAGRRLGQLLDLLDVELHPEIVGQQVHQGRVQLDLAAQRQVEVVLGGTPGGHDGRTQQHGRGRRGRTLRVLPRGQADGEETALDAPLLDQLARLVADGTGPAQRLGPAFRFGEQAADRHPAPVEQAGPGHLLGLADIERAGLEVAVVQQRVASTEVDQLAAPAAYRLANQH